MVRLEGSRTVRRQVKGYSLDMVPAIGYRATTRRAVQFRQGATGVLCECLVEGSAMDDEKLKSTDGQPLTGRPARSELPHAPRSPSPIEGNPLR